jgi:hypothetical protein
MRRRSQSEFESAMTLMAAGRGDYEIARLTAIPRPTITAWRHGRGTRNHLRLVLARPSWRPPQPDQYSYLLGLYLGDGCIQLPRRAFASIVITLDASYPGIVEAAAAALGACFPDTRVRRSKRMEGSVAVVGLGHPALPYAFPQHGAGRKHLRPIELEPWQREITTEFPQELLRGLIHSDGCRTMNRFKTKLPSGRVAAYEYPRYFFSNLSEDIRGIFCEHCEVLGIRWTQSNPRNISISHRTSVALMDEFIGPKW